MASPFVGEIRIVGFNFAPRGWAFCDGQLLPISQNTALFSLLGTMYGGNGTSTFALPNFQGCAPVGIGQGPGLSDYVQGQTGGVTAVTLLQTQMPAHTHLAEGPAKGGNQISPAGNDWAEGGVTRGQKVYAQAPGTLQQLAVTALGQAGSSLPHNNIPPVLVANFVIALQGIYPPRS